MNKKLHYTEGRRGDAKEIKILLKLEEFQILT